MFTGIITYTGSLVERENSTYTFKAPPLLIKKLDAGTSISIDGACLTVVKVPSKNTFCVEAMPETLLKTIIGQYKKGSLVNLELPATPTIFLSGHIVQGHIDGVGKIISITKDGNSRILTVAVPKKLARYIAPKGSIAINGVALTVISAGKTQFSVGIIPYTWENTSLRNVKVGDKLNLEVDILAKYIWQRT